MQRICVASDKNLIFLQVPHPGYQSLQASSGQWGSTLNGLAIPNGKFSSEKETFLWHCTSQATTWKLRFLVGAGHTVRIKRVWFSDCKAPASERNVLLSEAPFIWTYYNGHKVCSAPHEQVTGCGLYSVLQRPTGAGLCGSSLQVTSRGVGGQDPGSAAVMGPVHIAAPVERASERSESTSSPRCLHA